jgi:hypothetical protein
VFETSKHVVEKTVDTLMTKIAQPKGSYEMSSATGCALTFLGALTIVLCFALIVIWWCVGLR